MFLVPRVPFPCAGENWNVSVEGTSQRAPRNERRWSDGLFFVCETADVRIAIDSEQFHKVWR